MQHPLHARLSHVRCTCATSAKFADAMITFSQPTVTTRILHTMQDMVVFRVYGTCLGGGGRQMLGSLTVAAAAVRSLRHISGCFEVCCTALS